MNFATVDAICLSLDGTRRETLLGPGTSCWTIQGRMFATMENSSAHVGIRCLDEAVAQLLVDHGRARLLPHAPPGCWVALALSGDTYETNCRIVESYEMVRADG